MDQHHHVVKGFSSSSGRVYNSNSINNKNLQSAARSTTTASNSSSLQVVEDEEMMMMMMSEGVSSEDLRRGPWTVEEDFTLINYIAHHGEGRWNSLARCAGLKRTGKSCRLRWLNYLRPDVRRGNITLEEQLLILELHSRWGNRWSKIAQHLPGRTDNEIKNYWRTRVQKHAKQLKCDVNSKQFKDTMRYLWMPRLVERIQAAAASSSTSTATAPVVTTTNANTTNSNSNYVNDQISYHKMSNNNMDDVMMMTMPQPNTGTYAAAAAAAGGSSFTPENSSTGAASSDSHATQFSPVSDLTDCYNYPAVNQGNSTATATPQDYYQPNHLYHGGDTNTALTSPTGYLFNQAMDMPIMEQNNNNNAWMMTTMMDGGDVSENLWNVDDVWFLQQQLMGNNNINLID